MATANPLVSVIVTYYDYVDFLPETLRSIQSQTYSNLEVIVVDDCSPARPAAEIIAAMQLSNMRVLRQQTTQGPAAGTNVGVQQSSGQYIVPIDSDDLIDATYVSKCVSMIEATGCDGIYTQTNVFGDYELHHIPDCTALNIMAGKPGPTTFLYKREMFDDLGGYKTNVYHHDNEFWLSALVAGKTFKRIEEPLYFRRAHGHGRSSYNQSSEIPSLLQEHREQFIANLDMVLQLSETRYWELHNEHHHLRTEFQELLKQYNSLKGEFKDVLDSHDRLNQSFVNYRESSMPFPKAIKSLIKGQFLS